MSKTILSVEHLTKNYKDLCAVNDLNLTVKEGQIYGLIGPNGAGKSTTLECILGTKKQESGRIEILGMKMEKSKKDICKQVGVQFQSNFFLDRIRVGEMCQLISSLYEETVDWKELLHQFGLTDKIKTDVSKLSGGERQKLSVLIALINKPNLVFLDELTTGLDPKARRDVWNLLKMLQKEGLTILLTSHYMDEVEYLCDKITIINHGINVTTGTIDEIVNQSGMKNLEEAYLHYIGEEICDEGIYNFV